MERDYALYRDHNGRTGVVRLKPEGGSWRVVAVEAGLLSRERIRDHVKRDDLSSRLLTRAEAILALREWEAAYRLSQAYVVRPYSPLKAWRARWGWRDEAEAG
jgi:hypothetical protein